MVMIENLFEKLCSLISSGAEKLVHYVHKLAKTTAQYVSTKVSEDLSRLRNLWILLEASISSAMNNIKEKSLRGFRFYVKWVVQLFKWFTDQLVALIRTFRDVSKTASESLLPALLKMLKKREALGSKVTPLVDNLIRLYVKSSNGSFRGAAGKVVLVLDLMLVFGSLFDLINFFIE